MIKYRTNRNQPEIKETEVVRETEKCVFLLIGGRERRENKESEWHNYFDTWDSAHDYLLQRANKRVSAAESRFESECANRAEIEQLTPQKG